jgi:hypothetical protein
MNAHSNPASGEGQLSPSISLVLTSGSAVTPNGFHFKSPKLGPISESRKTNEGRVAPPCVFKCAHPPANWSTLVPWEERLDAPGIPKRVSDNSCAHHSS